MKANIYASLQGKVDNIENKSCTEVNNNQQLKHNPSIYLTESVGYWKVLFLKIYSYTQNKTQNGAHGIRHKNYKYLSIIILQFMSSTWFLFTVSWHLFGMALHLQGAAWALSVEFTNETEDRKMCNQSCLEAINITARTCDYVCILLLVYSLLHKCSWTDEGTFRTKLAYKNERLIDSNTAVSSKSRTYQCHFFVQAQFWKLRWPLREPHYLIFSGMTVISWT